MPGAFNSENRFIHLGYRMVLIFPTVTFLSPRRGQNKLNSKLQFFLLPAGFYKLFKDNIKGKKCPQEEENSTLKSISCFAALKLWWWDPIDLKSKIHAVIIELWPCLMPSATTKPGRYKFSKCLEICRTILIYHSWQYEPTFYNGH